MSKRTTGEVLGTSTMDATNDVNNISWWYRNNSYMAHLHGEIDVHGLCRRNKEYIESQNQDDDW